MIENLASVVLHLPFGLLLAAVALEFFAVSRKSKTADAAVITVLGTTAVVLAVACGVAGFIQLRNVGGIAVPFGSFAIGLGVTALAALALTFKTLCRKHHITGMPNSSRRRGSRRRGRGKRASDGFFKRASILLGYRGSLAAAAIALFASIFAAKSVISPAVAANESEAAEVEEADPSTADAEEGSPEETKPEPTVAATATTPPESPSTPGTPDTPEPAVAANTTEPETSETTAPPAPDTSTIPTEPEPEPTVAATTAEPASPTATTETPTGTDPPMEEDPATPEVASVTTPPGDPEMEEMDPATPAPTPAEPAPATPAAPAGTTPVSTGTTPAAPAPSARLRAERARFYASTIAPLFKGRCYDCHGAEKQKGGLRLDTPEWIRKGGDSGPILVVGQPDKSPVFVMTSLPPDDADIMPPKGRPLSQSQVGYIRRWILDGAELGDGKQWPGASEVASTGTSQFAEDEMAGGLSAPNQALIENLRATEVAVREVSENGAMLEIDFSHAGRAEGAMKLEELMPIAANIHTLDLKKTKIVDGDVRHIEKMTNLRKLNLALTKVSDSSMSHLEKLEHLEYLNLYGTEVGDRAAMFLKNLKGLKELHLWNSKFTDRGVRRLKEVLPSTKISFGA